MKDLGDGAGANSPAAFADGELGAFFHGDRVDEINREGDVVTRHNHVGPSGELDGAGDVGGTEEELRTIAVEEVSVAAAFLFGEDVGRRSELVVGDDGPGLGKDLTTLDLVVGDTTEEGADVVAGLGKVKGLAEHFEAGDDGLLGRLDANDFSFVVHLDLTTLDAAGDDGATAGDGHDVFDREKEGFVGVALGVGDIGVEGFEEFFDASAVGIVHGSGLASLEGGTLDDGDFVTREAILGEEVTDVHLNEVDELRVVDHVALVEEDDDVRNANLTGEQDVLTGLGHDAVSGGDNEDGSVHLGGAGDHVLDVVSVPRAVDVSVVTLFGLVFFVGGVDRNTTSPFLGAGVDVAISFVDSVSFGAIGGFADHGKVVGDGRGKGGLAVVNVADGTNVHVNAVTVELFFCHLLFPPKMVFSKLANKY